MQRIFKTVSIQFAEMAKCILSMENLYFGNSKDQNDKDNKITF
jgi:hypothetical protein